MSGFGAFVQRVLNRSRRFSASPSQFGRWSLGFAIAIVAGLIAGQQRDVRFDYVQMKKGNHTLKTVADPAHVIDESKDDNDALRVIARGDEVG